MTAISSWILADAVGLIAIAAVLVAVITLFIVWRQTKLLRKQLFGEVYDRAQIRNLEFFLPEQQKHAVEGFQQKEDSEVALGNCITIPVGCERELHIRWWMAESQTLRTFSIGFPDEYAGRHFGFKNKPKITEKIKAFDKRTYSSLVREEYIDWHGYYHCEYAHLRRLPKGECFVTALRVKGEQKGRYVLAVEIFVAEAPHPFGGYLEVECE